MYLLLAVPPKFGLTCYGSGDSLGITYNCTLAEKVISVQCFVDNQLQQNCMFNTDNMTQQLSRYINYYVFSMILGSLPLHLPHAKYSVGIHAVAIVFEQLLEVQSLKHFMIFKVYMSLEYIHFILYTMTVEFFLFYIIIIIIIYVKC